MSAHGSSSEQLRPGPRPSGEPPQPWREPGSHTATLPDRAGPPAGPIPQPPPTDHVFPPLPATITDQGALLPDIPGYRLLEEIGRGGMGTVYRAVHLALAREVALKLIHPAGHSEPTVRARFEREVRTLAHIEHPNIVPVYDVGYWQGFPYYTMKYVARGTLDRHMPRARQDLRGACRLLAKVARAVHRLHAAGVVHRDLKPENVLLDDGDEPLVADFGLALWAGDGGDLTASGLPVGTRHYMAPEQTLAQKADYGPATDVWALGVMIYELLTGRRPFEGGEIDALYRRIREQQPPAAAGVDPALEAIARKCLAKRPCDRYPDAAAVAADLDRWAAGEPVSATVRAEPAPGRRPFGALMLLLGLLVAVGGLLAVLHPYLDHRLDGAPLTAAEKLRAGQPVELIGPSGAPLTGPVTVAGAPGVLSTDREGFFTLACLRFAAVDLLREELPLPVRFEVEVAVSRGQDDHAWVGVYAGRKEYPEAGAANHSQAQLGVRRYPRPAKLGGTVDAIGSEVLWWCPDREAVRTELDRTTTAHPDRTGFPPGLAWHRLSLTVHPDRVTATADGRELAPVPGGEVLRLGDGFLRRGWLPLGPAPAPPAFGPGVGLCVENAEGVFRNARLVPLDR